MNGFEEVARRDAIRQRTITEAVGKVRDLIRTQAPAGSHEERTWLQLSVAMALLKGVQMEAMSLAIRAEMTAATGDVLDKL